MSEPGYRIFPQRLETDAESVERDLFKLVLTIIELVRQLMEKQALRRVEEGDLTDEQVEGLGLGLMHLEAAMDELKTLDGQAFDRRFLELMIEHHRGALTMAEQEVDSGLNEDAIALANTIIAAQQEEIAEMEGMLEKMG